MANKGTGRWAALLAASFVAHVALTVNSTDTALWNEQGREGSLLVQQLADAAAPVALSRDMVSLSVLASRYETRAGIASVRLYNGNRELIAETGSSRNDGRLFRAPIQLQGQALGQVELRLTEFSRGDIVRLSLGNIALSGLLHGLIFIAGLLLSPRVQESLRGASRPTSAESRPDAVPAPAQPRPATAPVAAATTGPATLLHIALDDPNALLTRVNASMADEMLSLFDQFVDRAARLYGGEVSAPFSPAGVQLRFLQDDAQEREFHALAAAGLFLQLVEDSLEERRQHGLLCLGAKAGVLHEGEHDEIASILAQMAPAARILSSQPQSNLSTLCRLGASHQLDIGQGVLQVVLVENFAPEYQQLIHNQSQQILGPTEAA
ncbi:MAG TPA: hypothetical protein VF050_09485 [Moraxellaceae bacterium]